MLLMSICAPAHSSSAAMRLPAFAPVSLCVPRPSHACCRMPLAWPARMDAGRVLRMSGGRSSSTRDRGTGPGESARRDVRIFLSQPLVAAEGAVVDFSPEQGHYLHKVMRVAEGSEIKVFDGVSGEWWCRLDAVAKASVHGVLTEQRRAMAPEPDLWLVFAPVKGDGTESIVQKSTELGASRILPIMTQRTVVKAQTWVKVSALVYALCKASV